MIRNFLESLWDNLFRPVLTSTFFWAATVAAGLTYLITHSNG